MKTVLLIGTLDTKGEEYRFVRELIMARGHRTLVMDLGVMGEPPFEPDITPRKVAAAGGGRLPDLRAKANRGAAVAVMQAGACALTQALYARGGFDGVLGLGGGGGTTMITAAMRQLPVGVPNVMVSTMASGNTAPCIDVKDLTLMYPVVDIAGLNPLSRRILSNAAGAVSGMVEQAVPVQAGRARSWPPPCSGSPRLVLPRPGSDANELPLNIPVEIEMIGEVAPGSGGP